MRYKIWTAILLTAAISGAFFQWQGEMIGEMRSRPDDKAAMIDSQPAGFGAPLGVTPEQWWSLSSDLARIAKHKQENEQ